MRQYGRFFPPFSSSSPTLLYEPARVLPIVSGYTRCAVEPISVRRFYGVWFRALAVGSYVSYHFRVWVLPFITGPPYLYCTFVTNCGISPPTKPRFGVSDLYGGRCAKFVSVRGFVFFVRGLHVIQHPTLVRYPTRKEGLRKEGRTPRHRLRQRIQRTRKYQCTSRHFYTCHQTLSRTNNRQPIPSHIFPIRLPQDTSIHLFCYRQLQLPRTLCPRIRPPTTRGPTRALYLRNTIRLHTTLCRSLWSIPMPTQRRQQICRNRQQLSTKPTPRNRMFQTKILLLQTSIMSTNTSNELNTTKYSSRRLPKTLYSVNYNELHPTKLKHRPYIKTTLLPSPKYHNNTLPLCQLPYRGRTSTKQTPTTRNLYQTTNHRDARYHEHSYCPRRQLRLTNQIIAKTTRRLSKQYYELTFRPTIRTTRPQP